MPLCLVLSFTTSSSIQVAMAEGVSVSVDVMSVCISLSLYILSLSDLYWAGLCLDKRIRGRPSYAFSENTSCPWALDRPVSVPVCSTTNPPSSYSPGGSQKNDPKKSPRGPMALWP